MRWLSYVISVEVEGEKINRILKWCSNPNSCTGSWELCQCGTRSLLFVRKQGRVTVHVATVTRLANTISPAAAAAGSANYFPIQFTVSTKKQTNKTKSSISSNSTPKWSLAFRETNFINLPENFSLPCQKKKERHHNVALARARTWISQWISHENLWVNVNQENICVMMWCVKMDPDSLLHFLLANCVNSFLQLLYCNGSLEKLTEWIFRVHSTRLIALYK